MYLTNNIDQMHYSFNKFKNNQILLIYFFNYSFYLYMKLKGV
jgi:hypothetical protein